ncbi:type III-B CRISPR module-associated protein Cmr5 [Clostridium algidicarnis]|uniref:Type III-B CRISPR module-associated protein Cmr5 n=1 Tax=Clostridium algidicarnis TaxID=37659 RepID=A0ABS6C2B2_9CLOT|nr:type III-B CRISPR module-associated protein Cmr5 [Clostridium algidicarnis]MBU3219625.1 type III-B CRISPR module-associated protein Cmr5 [Clostridium algidicarnis]
MNKREIEEQIPIAIDLINEYINVEKFDDKNPGLIPKEYNGYISSFGASIIQSGLVSTISFFEANSSKSKEDKKVLTSLILQVIKIHKCLELGDNESLLSYVLNNKNTFEEVEEEVINATIAIKLSIRVFKFTESNESQVNCS